MLNKILIILFSLCPFNLISQEAAPSLVAEPITTNSQEKDNNSNDTPDTQATQKESKSTAESVETENSNLSAAKSSPSKFNLEQQLTADLEVLNKDFEESSKKYQTWKGLAITGYSLTGFGLGLVIVDSLAPVGPYETANPNSQEKFHELSWSAIPITIIGLVFGVTFNILEEKEKEKKLILESELYDVKNELDVLQLQIYDKKE